MVLLDERYIYMAENENNEIGLKCFLSGVECFKNGDYEKMEYYFQKAENFYGATSKGYLVGSTYEFKEMKKMRDSARGNIQLNVFEDASKLNEHNL